jgi:anti-sigma factor RsiW
MVTAVLLTLSGPAVAAAVAYDRLNHEWWTGASTVPAAAAPPRDEAVPQPSPQAPPPEPKPRATQHPWPLGSCITSTATRSTPCTSGALRVVGSIHTRTGTPCHDVPEATHVRRAGAYTLCLASI